MKDDRGELDMTKQLEEKDQLIQELRMRIRDMLMISEQHRNILGEEIGKRKELEKEIKQAFVHGQGNSIMMEAGLERNEREDYTSSVMRRLTNQEDE